jgi:hypothetical protein
LENESAPFAQADDLLHALRIIRRGHTKKLTADYADVADNTDATVTKAAKNEQDFSASLSVLSA